MKPFRLFVIVGVAAVLPLAASAQTPPDRGPSPQTAPAAQGTSPQTAPAAQGTSFHEVTSSHWLVSGFVGSNFAEDADEASVDFGGTAGYLWRGIAGGEFQANFSPNFELAGSRRALLLGDRPWINSYMGNGITALPLGADGRWRPYVSGGLGVLTLRADTLLSNGERNEIEPDDTRFAGNIGAGFMGFARNLGFRGDVRYFRGFESSGRGDFDPVESPTEAVGNQILSELAFWRANVGVVVRW